MRLLKYFRFSLRTLALLMITGGAGAALWHNFQPWRIQKAFHCPEQNVNSFYLSKDGQWIVGLHYDWSTEGHESPRQFLFNLWNVQSGEHRVVMDKKWFAHATDEGISRAAFFSNDSKWVCAFAYDRQFARGTPPDGVLWNIEKRIATPIPVESPGSLRRAMFTSDSRFLLIGNSYGSVKWFDLNSQQIAKTVSGIRNAGIFLSGDRVAFVGIDDGIRIHNALTGEELHRVPKQAGWKINRIKFLRDNFLCITAIPDEMEWDEDMEWDDERGVSMFFDFKQPAPVFTYKGELASISKSNRFAVTEKNRTLEILDLQSNSTLLSLPNRFNPRSTWNSDESKVLIQYFYPLLFDQANGKVLYTLNETQSCWVFEDWNRLICAEGKSDRLLSIRDASDGKLLQLIRGHRTETVPELFKDGYHFVTHDVAQNRVCYWTRYRPEEWWGVVYLVEFWLTLLLAGATIWSVVKDRRGIARRL